MNLKKYLKTWEGTQTENKWGRIFQGGLIAIVFLLVVQVFSKETIVTIQPFTLTEEAWVTKSNASQSYKEAWGFAFAQLLGNVTPGTVDFVKERILALSLALGTSMAYASDDIPVVPASVMKKDVPAPVTSGQSSHEVVGSMNENP
ncbi:TPA: TraE/TraK family type IV conjugative transfer system protein, partial [Escherichia coli]